MKIRSKLTTAAACVVTGLVVAPAAGAAQHSVKGEIEVQEHVIASDPDIKKLEAGFTATTVAQIKTLTKEVSVAQKKLAEAADAVAKVPATFADATPQAEWVFGTRDEARAFTHLAKALVDLTKHSKTGAKAEVASSNADVKKGAGPILAADQALGVAPAK